METNLAADGSVRIKCCLAGFVIHAANQFETVGMEIILIITMRYYVFSDDRLMAGNIPGQGFEETRWPR